MQSTEEYLDQLLASVSDEAGAGQSMQQNTEKKHHKSIEELDESELTEEVLQKQLALLLGLETEPDEDEFEEDDFITQYTEQVSEPVNVEIPAVSSEIMEIPEEEPAAEPVMESVAEVIPESAAEPETSASELEISSTGVLSADEIEALFASMGVEEEEPSLGDAIVEEMLGGFPDETDENAEMAEKLTDDIEDVVEVIEEAEEPAPAPQISDSGVLSPDEIAALFASMGAEDAVETEDVVELVEEEDTGALTREELEELGLGDIADVLSSDAYDQMADDLEEINHPHDINHQEVELNEDSAKIEPEEEKQIIEIPDFENNEEILLDIENVDAMLEATAKMAEEESADNMETQVEDDILSMLAQFEEESVMESMAAQEESARAAEEAVNMALEEETPGVPEELLADDSEGKKKKKPKKEKVKKEKVKKEKPVKEKKEKVSLKDRIAAFMFEDDSLEDEAGESLSEGAEGNDLLEAKPAKAKKEKASKKDKKAKKAKADKAQDENAAIEAELVEEDKKKAKKKEKPPKEKKAKKVVFADAAEAEEEKKKTKGAIGTRGIVATFLVCASILGLILVGTYFVPKQLSLVAARVAFYAQNYEETAMRLKGQNLNDSDRIMYEKANLLYGLEERYHQYEVYMQRGMSKEALNALFQGVAACNEEEILAGQLGIESEWKLAKDAFINALQEQFNVDAQTAETIASLRNPDYTVAVENILAGRVYNDMSSYGGEAPVNPEDTEQESEADAEEPEENLEDLLPEEEEILQQMQQENAESLQEEPEASADSENDVLYSGSVEGGEVNFVE